MNKTVWITIVIPAYAYYCKRPSIQLRDEDARKQLEDFINENE